MKKTLFSLIAILILFSACSKDDNQPVEPPEQFSYSYAKSTEPVTGNNIVVVTFHAEKPINSSRLYFEDPSVFISSSITFSGNTATITTKSTGINTYWVYFIQSDGFKQHIGMSTKISNAPNN